MQVLGHGISRAPVLKGEMDEMNKKIVQICTLLIVISITIQFIMPYILSVQEPIFYDTPYYVRTSAQGSMEGNLTEAYVYDYENDIKYSFLTYAHINGEVDGPVVKSDGVTVSFQGITYHFSLDDLDHPQITFPLNQRDSDRYSLYNDGKKLIVKKVSKLPYSRKHIVCELPEENCFYSPVSISKLNRYSIIVMKSDKTVNHITIYIPDENGTWEQVPFIMPDGTVTEEFSGLAQRHFNATVGANDRKIGDLELCQTNADGTATLYDVTYSDGQLLLTESKQYENGMPPDWKF